MAINSQAKKVTDLPVLATNNDSDKLLVHDGSGLKQESLGALREAMTNSLKDTFTGATNALSIKETVSGESIHVEGSANMPLVELKIFGKTTQEAGASPTTPKEMTSIEGVEIRSDGGNIFDYNEWKTTLNNRGVQVERGTITWNAGESFTLKATASDCYTVVANQNFGVPVLPNTPYTLSWDATNNKQGLVYAFDATGSSISVITAAQAVSKKLTFTTPEGCEKVAFRFGVALSGDSTTYSNIKLEYGSEVTSYCPYQEPVKGTFDGVLRGVPVATGGNCIDANDQRYWADILKVNADGTGCIYRHTIGCNFNTGTQWNQVPQASVPTYYVGLTSLFGQRRMVMQAGFTTEYERTVYTYANAVDKKCMVVDNSVVITDSTYSTLDAWRAHVDAHPITALIACEVPQIEDLTAEQVQAIKQHMSYLPVTNVYNNKNAPMQITYVADPKTFIRNEITKAITAHESETA